MHLQGWPARETIFLHFLLTSFPKEKQTRHFSSRRNSSEKNMQIKNFQFLCNSSQSNILESKTSLGTSTKAFLCLSHMHRHMNHKTGRKFLSYSDKGTDCTLDGVREAGNKVWVRRNFWQLDTEEQDRFHVSEIPFSNFRLAGLGGHIGQRNVSVYMDAKQKGESGAQQAPSQAFVLTEAINGCTFAWTSPFWLQQHRVGQQPHWTWQQQYWGQHWHQHIPTSRRRRRPPRMMRSTVSQSVGKKEEGLILMHLAMVAYWAPLHCWRCLGVKENRRQYLGNKAQALTENNQLNLFVRITWGISWCFHSAVVHAMVPPHDLTDDKVCSCGRGTERSVGSLRLTGTTFRLHLKRALCLQETESTASPLFPSIAITFKQSHLSPLRTPTNSIHSMPAHVFCIAGSQPHWFWNTDHCPS